MRQAKEFEPGQVCERIVTDFVTVKQFLPGTLDAVRVENKLGRPFKAAIVLEGGRLRITLEWPPTP